MQERQANTIEIASLAAKEQVRLALVADADAEGGRAGWQATREAG